MYIVPLYIILIIIISNTLYNLNTLNNAISICAPCVSTFNLTKCKVYYTYRENLFMDRNIGR